MKYANGDTHKGHWNEDFMCGEGTMKYANGDKFKGKWEDDYR